MTFSISNFLIIPYHFRKEVTKVYLNDAIKIEKIGKGQLRDVPSEVNHISASGLKIPVWIKEVKGHG